METQKNRDFLAKNLRGTGVAVVTPFNEDFSIDTESIIRLVDFLIDNGVSEEWEVQIKNKNIASETINFQFKIKKSLISNHEIYIKPLPLKNVPGIINDYIEVNLQKNYVTKLIAANIKLFDTNQTSMPELIQCRINNTVPNLELSYRGITLSALILPKHVADYHKYMKPIKNKPWINPKTLRITILILALVFSCIY